MRDASRQGKGEHRAGSSAHTSSSRVERRKGKTRQRLVEGALRLFYEKGLHWTKVEDITERADVGKGTFYRHFETKEALVQEILQQGFDLLLVRIQDTIRSLEPRGSVTLAVIQAQLGFYSQHPEYLVLFHDMRGLLRMRTSFVKELRDVYDDHLGRLTLIVRPAVSDRTSPASPRELAMALSVFTSGLLFDHLLFEQGEVHVCRETLQAQLERSIQALI